MPMHEHFEELCALSAISQLSADEHQELIAHLDACDRCKRAEDDFTLILDQLPAADPPNDSEDVEELLSKNYEKRFVARAAAEGISFSVEAKRLPRRFSSRLWPIRIWDPNVKLVLTVAAMLAVAALVVLGARVVHQYDNGKVLVSSQPVVSKQSDPKPLAATETVPIPAQQASVVGSTTTSNVDSERRLKALQQRLAQALQDKGAAEADLNQLKQELASVKQRSDNGEQALAEATKQIERLQQTQNEMVASMVARQTKLEELSEQLNVQRSSVERDRELSAVTSEVRELMGTRNLHIIDVNDYDDRLHKRGKSFGRVFYCEGKSLIFYAFDLSQKTSASKVTFQAWGQRMGGDAVARNLGTFNIDDHVQRRWVLRVNDPQLLTSIDSLFVTVEPSPGRDQPSGKRLLFAYLGSEANHP